MPRATTQPPVSGSMADTGPLQKRRFEPQPPLTDEVTNEGLAPERWAAIERDLAGPVQQL